MKKQIYCGNCELFSDGDLKQLMGEIKAEKVSDCVYYSHQHDVVIAQCFEGGCYDTKVVLFGASPANIAKIEQLVLGTIKSVKRNREGIRV